MGALALLGAVVASSAFGAERLAGVVTSIGCAGLFVTALALAGRWSALLPWGFVGVGASYALFLSLRHVTVDGRAPILAAAFFMAAELSFWSIERQGWRTERQAVIRRLGLVASTGLATAILGGLLLLATSGGELGLGAEAAGVAAAVLTLVVIAAFARRSRQVSGDDLAETR